MPKQGLSTLLEHRILEEVLWTKKEVKLSYLRVFSCVLYVHINDHGRNKLNVKSLKYTFIGYGVDYFGYKFWDDQNKKVIRSRDFIFNEIFLYKNRDATKSNKPSTT